MSNHQRIAYSGMSQLADEIRELLPAFFNRSIQSFRLQLGLDYTPPIKLEPNFVMNIALACKVQRLPLVPHVPAVVVWTKTEMESDRLYSGKREFTLPHKALELMVNLQLELGDAASYRMGTIGSAEGLAQTMGAGGQRIYVVP